MSSSRLTSCSRRSRPSRSSTCSAAPTPSRDRHDLQRLRAPGLLPARRASWRSPGCCCSGAHEVVGRTRPFLLAALALLGLTGVILASAAVRLSLYQGAYGWTELRFFVAASVGWLGVAVVLAAALLVQDRMRWLPHGLAMSAVAITLARLRDGSAGVRDPPESRSRAGPEPRRARWPAGIDLDYGMTLGDDAIPDLVAALRVVPPVEGSTLLGSCNCAARSSSSRRPARTRCRGTWRASEHGRRWRSCPRRNAARRYDRPPMDLLPALGLVGLLLVKEAGVPVPVPGDLLVLGAGIAAAGAGIAAGAGATIPAPILLAAILAAGFVGGSVQFALVRGAFRDPLLRLLTRFGVPRDRLDGLAGWLRQRGAVGVAVARATPGVRVGAAAASGLAALPFGRPAGPRRRKHPVRGRAFRARQRSL